MMPVMLRLAACGQCCFKFLARGRGPSRHVLSLSSSRLRPEGPVFNFQLEVVSESLALSLRL